MEKTPVEKCLLHQPALQDLAMILQKKLEENFKEVCVKVVDCPNLAQEPFFLQAQGLGGSPKLLEIGGPPYLLPLVNKSKVYDMKTLKEEIQAEPCLMIGAGAGPWVHVGKNCEMVANVYFEGSDVKSGTYFAKMEEGDSHLVGILPPSETRFCLLANLFSCEGKPGKVLEVSCKGRTGPHDFPTSIRLGLKDEYKDQPVGLGGAFLMKVGKAKHHIMPAFSRTPLKSEEEVNSWLKFFDFRAPLVSVGTLVSTEVANLDLRVQHFHSYSKHGEAGHYHYDLTPDTVEYLGYFNLGEALYRFDRPQVTHQYGRD